MTLLWRFWVCYLNMSSTLSVSLSQDFQHLLFAILIQLNPHAMCFIFFTGSIIPLELQCAVEVNYKTVSHICSPEAAAILSQQPS